MDEALANALWNAGVAKGDWHTQGKDQGRWVTTDSWVDSAVWA